MALKLRKEVKKSLYYVWFLGAKESKGLRGVEHVLPVVEHLEERAREVEPCKVTLQVSYKGIKIIQNIVVQGIKGAKPKTETIKHSIPHDTITCVYQRGEIVACILLLFNPVTRCPLHVHAYRCDSKETASLLTNQLRNLIERPDAQKKLSEIEARLVKHRVDSSVDSDAGTSTSDDRCSNTLYDSVAAELRAKLGSNGEVPILLPPRDYDTVHRQKGNLTGIELRRCLNANIVGQNVATKLDGSGASSGIGSDHTPDSPEGRYNRPLDGQSTSDEEWSADYCETSHLDQRYSSDINKQDTNCQFRQIIKQNTFRDDDRNFNPATSSKPRLRLNRDTTNKVEPPITIQPRRRAEQRQRSPSPENVSPRDRFRDAKEKFMLLERRTRQELPISPQRDKTFLKRHESLVHPMKDEEEQSFSRTEKYEFKRRSMFLPMQEEQRRNLCEAAKEVKRRTYLEQSDSHEDEGYVWPHVESNQRKNPLGYRHSYAEPKPRGTEKNYTPQILYRINSSVSNNGRVGLASVQPY